MSTVTHEVLLALRDLFATRFSGDELKDLALELEIDLEDIPGTTRKAKARELAQYLNRRGLMDKLRQKGPELYPELPWAEVFDGVIPQSSTVSSQDNAPKDSHIAPSPVNPTILTRAERRQLMGIIAAHHNFETQSARRAFLKINGLDGVITGNLDGAPQTVATMVLVQTLEFGDIEEGVPAIAVLVDALIDDSLPRESFRVLNEIKAKYGWN